MGGPERQLKMDKSREFGGFTNSTAFSRMNADEQATAFCRVNVSLLLHSDVKSKYRLAAINFH